MRTRKRRSDKGNAFTHSHTLAPTLMHPYIHTLLHSQIDASARLYAPTSIAIYSGGAVYEGDYRDGNKDGKGKMISSNGDVYEGDWRSNEESGEGKTISSNGDVALQHYHLTVFSCQ